MAGCPYPLCPNAKEVPVDLGDGGPPIVYCPKHAKRAIEQYDGAHPPDEQSETPVDGGTDASRASINEYAPTD